MKIAIRYYSKGGNTKLMAETLASKCELTAESTEVNLTEKVDLLFLGSSVYGGKYNKEVEAFLNNNKDLIGEVVCFGSSASGKSTQPQVKKWGDANGVLVNEKFFNCPGHFLFMHKDRPNASDLEQLVEFANGVVNR